MTHFQPEGAKIPVSSPPAAKPHSRRPLYVALGIASLLGIGIVAGIFAHGPAQPKETANASGAINRTSVDAKRFTDNLDQQHMIVSNSLASGSAASQKNAVTDPASTAAAPPSPYPVPQQMSRAEQERYIAYDREQAAVDSPLTLTDPSSSVATAPSATSVETPDLSQLASLYAATTHTPTLGSPPTEERPKALPPDQPMPSVRIPAPGEYILPAGTHITAILTMAVDTELPGIIEAQVESDIMDHFRNVIIPFGSILLGDVATRVSFGGKRIAQIWNRIRFPDDSILVLNDLSGHDQTGSAGLPGKVNNHIGKLIESAAITTVFAAGVAVSQRQNTSLFASPSVGSTIAQSAGSSLAEANSELMRRTLDIQPTAKLDPGTPLDIPTTRDIIVDAPYKPYIYGETHLLSASK